MPKRKVGENKLARPIVVESSNLLEFALVPVRDTIIFPHLMSPLIVGREPSIRAVEAAMAKDQRIVVFLQRDPDTQDPKPE
jgi:ATP-dependent Lon protease